MLGNVLKRRNVTLPGLYSQFGFEALLGLGMAFSVFCALVGDRRFVSPAVLHERKNTNMDIENRLGTYMPHQRICPWR